MCKSAIEGQPIGLFIGPNIPGIWSVENSSNATVGSSTLIPQTALTA